MKLIKLRDLKVGDKFVFPDDRKKILTIVESPDENPPPVYACYSFPDGTLALPIAWKSDAEVEIK